VTSLEIATGLVLMLVVPVDVFLTVLYARIGSAAPGRFGGGIVSPWIGRMVWAVFKRLGPREGDRRDAVLSFCGPTVVVALLLTWALLPIVGAAMVVHPALGTGVRSSSGASDADFVTALYVGSTTVSIASSGSYAPTTTAYRLFFVASALLGSSVLALTVTYVLQIYTALQRRNVLGLNIYLLTRRTQDAAVLLAGLGRRGSFEDSGSIVAALAENVSDLKEAHHFYPLLFFFHPRWPHTSVAEIALVTSDLATLIETALDDDAYANVKRWAVTDKLGAASRLLAETLDDAFVPDRYAEASKNGPDDETRERWRRRYRAALRTLRDAGLRTTADEDAGAVEYVRLRSDWDAHVAPLVHYDAYAMQTVDPATAQPPRA